MSDVLISMWWLAMANQSLCDDSRSHIEYVLAMEFRTVTP